MNPVKTWSDHCIVETAYNSCVNILILESKDYSRGSLCFNSSQQPGTTELLEMDASTRDKR